MNCLKILVSASVLALAATSAPAQVYGTWTNGTGGSQILNDQINLQNNWSTMNFRVDTVGGDAVAQGAAAGNLVDITTMNNTRVNNNQIVGPGGTISSTAIGNSVANVWGSVGIQTQALCNGASISTDPILTSVHSNQECNAADPFSRATGTITNVGGDAVVQSMAQGNSFEADSNAPNMPIMTRQTNRSAIVSGIEIGAHNIGGSVGLSSSAIGNSSQIIHYSTH